MLTITWRILPDRKTDIHIAAVEDHLSTLLLAPDAPGEEAARVAVLEWLGEQDWNRVFGAYDGAALLIEIRWPTPQAGRYLVDLRRVVEASARKMDPGL